MVGIGRSLGVCEGVVGEPVAGGVPMQPAVAFLGVAVALGVGVEVVLAPLDCVADRSGVQPLRAVKLLVRERPHLRITPRRLSA